MSNTRKLINLATRLAAEPDREAAIRQLATEAQGDRELVRRAYRRLTQEYLPTEEAETAATLLGALLDPTRGWATEADDLDQRLLDLVRDAEAQMRVLAGGDPRRLREAAERCEDLRQALELNVMEDLALSALGLRLAALTGSPG
jgi:DnaJ-domain-containing protein 1